ncbi:MAG: hypothetical protein QXG22_00015 [Candidatus Hadarchaeales archaeon]
MLDKKNGGLLAVLFLLLAFLGFSKWRGEEGCFFELVAERVVMSGWKMEPAEYGGYEVTKITADSSILSNLTLSPLGTFSPLVEVRKLTVYALSVEGTAGGVEAGWEKGNVPLRILELLLPRENAEMTGVRMKILAMEAEEMVPFSLRVEATSLSDFKQVNMPYVRMRGWEMRGPEDYRLPSGKEVKVTLISVQELSGEMYMGYKRCVLGGKVEQRKAEIRSIETRGQVLGFGATWLGSQQPPNLRELAKDPALMTNVGLKLLLLQAENTVLREVSMKIMGM